MISRLILLWPIANKHSDLRGLRALYSPVAVIGDVFTAIMTTIGYVLCNFVIGSSFIPYTSYSNTSCSVSNPALCMWVFVSAEFCGLIFIGLVFTGCKYCATQRGQSSGFFMTKTNFHTK